MAPPYVGPGEQQHVAAVREMLQSKVNYQARDDEHDIVWATLAQ
jgi:hypothetical protein